MSITGVFIARSSIPSKTDIDIVVERSWELDADILEFFEKAKSGDTFTITCDAPD